MTWKELVKWVKDKLSLSWAKEAFNNFNKATWTNQRITNKLMNNFYPSRTVTGDTYKKRESETKKLVNQWKIKEAKINLKNLTADFKRRNPEYTQK